VITPPASPGQGRSSGRLSRFVPLEHLLVAGGQQVEIGAGLHHIPEHPAESHRLAQPLRRPRLLQQGQPRAEILQLLGLFQTHAPHHPLHGAEQVHRHRHRAADHILEQQAGATAGQHPIGDGGQFLVGVDGGGDPPQLAALLQQRQKAPQITGGTPRQRGRH
jgi:hypothetical protein